MLNLDMGRFVAVVDKIKVADTSPSEDGYIVIQCIEHDQENCPICLEEKDN